MVRKKKDSCCKTALKVLFSHIGLSAMVVLYCVAGGFIFEHLEKNNEEQICYESRDEYTPMESKTINSTLQVFVQYGGVTMPATRDLMVVQLRSILETFRSNTLAIGYDGRDCGAYGQEGGPTHSWSWAGGLMFSVTVVSTIAFSTGHHPQTEAKTIHTDIKPINLSSRRQPIVKQPAFLCLARITL